MAAAMFREGSFLAKALPALGTLIKPLPVVCSLVADELIFPGKVLPAFGALKWLLPCVDSLMTPQMFSLPEGLSTLSALEWFLSRVDTLVSYQVDFPLEAFLALRALIRPLPSGDSRREAFPKQKTFVWAFPDVKCLMLLQCLLVPEALLALRTLKESLASVDPLVFRQRRFCGKDFATHRAFVQLLTGVNLLMLQQHFSQPVAFPTL